MSIEGLYPCFNHWQYNNSTIHIISDTHFDDTEVEAKALDRPDSEDLVKYINSKVGKNDTLIHLGDVGNIEFIKQLKGAKKILICGNHDVGHTKYEARHWDKKFDKNEYTKEDALKEMKRLYPEAYKYSIKEMYQFQAPFEYWHCYANNCLFDEVYTGPLVIGEKLILSHEPIPNLNWAMNIHGHIHSRNHKNDKYHFNVCCDAIGYLPVNFNQWMKQGYLSNIEPLHRITIDKATERSKRCRK